MVPQTQKVKNDCFRPSVPNLGYAYPLGVHNQLGKIPKINGNGGHFDVTLYKASSKTHSESIQSVFTNTLTLYQNDNVICMLPEGLKKFS